MYGFFGLAAFLTLYGLPVFVAGAFQLITNARLGNPLPVYWKFLGD